MRSLNTVVTEMTAILHQLIGTSTELVFTPAEDPGLVEVDRGQIEALHAGHRRARGQSRAGLRRRATLNGNTPFILVPEANGWCAPVLASEGGIRAPR